jgi:hypothetical protein
MSSYSDLASISSAIENLELGDTFHDQDEEISVEDPIIVNLVLLTYLFFFNYQFLKYPDFKCLKIIEVLG